jgi:histidyl-tRNA synthetase
VAGGGRYDGLIKALGGPEMPATGFAIGFDRLAEVSGLNNSDFEQRPHVFLAALGEKSMTQAFEWSCALGLEGIRTAMDFGGRSLKSQMKRADRLGAEHVLIVGDKELAEGAVVLRNMTSKEQLEISMKDIVQKLRDITSGRL